MGMYVPGMQQRFTGYDAGKNIANNLLEAVKMNREFEHKDNVMDLEEQKIAIQEDQFKKTNERADKDQVIRQEDWDYRKKNRQNMEDITQGIAKYKIADSKHKGSTNEYLEKMDETSWLGTEIDPDDKRFYFGAKDETGERRFIQHQTPRKMAGKYATADGDVKPEYDPKLIETMTDPSMLKYLPQFAGSNEGGENLLYEATFNSLMEE